jgi:hypothetical protein
VEATAKSVDKFREKAMFTNMQITDIITSQNLLFDLAEREADRNGFKHDPRVERQLSSHPLWFNQMELTVKAPCGLTLDFEAKRPAKNPLPEVQCTVKFGVIEVRINNGYIL